MAASRPLPDRQPLSAPAGVAGDCSESWPPPWLQLWSRTRPAPVLWTYMELGLDMTGQGSPQRSALLKRLVSDLGFPKGSSAFWPFCLPGDDAAGADCAPEAGPFYQGLRQLAPKVLILCGKDAVPGSRLPLALRRPFTQEFHQGMLTLLLPDLAAMQEDKIYQQALAFLRGALSDLAILRPR